MSSTSRLDLNEEILYAMNVLTPFIHMNGVEISVKVTPDCWVLGDRQKFRQCLINLVKNSVESMENGGELSIGNLIKEKQALIFIRDNGVGMTPEQMNRLGTPFYSTKEKGTGLGTMVAFSIVRAMGGEIEIQSTKDKGTLIQLYLPIHQPDS